jgi:hypothetical protein
MKTMTEIGFMVAMCSDVPWMGKLMFSDLMLRLAGPKDTDKSGFGLMMGLVDMMPLNHESPSRIIW